MRRSPAAVACALPVVVVVVAGGLAAGSCATAAPTAAPARQSELVATGVAPWLGLAGVAPAADLDEAAALLCARDTDSVIDEEARRATGVVDGVVVGRYEQAATRDEARGALALSAGPLAAAIRATHVGVAEVETASGARCAAFVAARRALVLLQPLPALLPAPTPFSLQARLLQDAATARVFLLEPDGYVRRIESAVEGGRLAEQIVPKKGQGSYVLEVVVDDGREPRVALLWPFTVGRARRAPAPEVLFGDEGHSDLALTRRSEALVSRLRDLTLVEPLKIWPVLAQTAAQRAAALAEAGALGHLVPDGRNAAQDVAARAPQAQLSRLAEVQAMGGTLTEAWTAMVESPAHRAELVDPTLTHMGVAVARGVDGAARPVVSLVVVLVRKPVDRDPVVAEQALLQALDDVRTSRGLDPLLRSTRLDRLAQRLVVNMADRGLVDEAGLGEPIARMALQDDASLVEVRPVIARLDDPMRIELPDSALDIDTSSVGMGIARGARDHLWYVVVLLGTGGS